jgi:hypothetical protein
LNSPLLQAASNTLLKGTITTLHLTKFLNSQEVTHQAGFSGDKEEGMNEPDSSIREYIKKRNLSVTTASNDKISE